MVQSPDTIDELEILCRKIAPSSLGRVEGYRPTPNQVYFFTRVWVLNQGNKKIVTPLQSNTKSIIDLDADVLAAHAHEVVRHLAQESGEIVTKLRVKDQQTWYALAHLMMRTAGKGFDCPKQMKEDAASSGLEKVLKVISNMLDHCDPQLLDNTANVAELAMQICIERIRIYDFRTHFYNFTQWIVRNELISLLRKAQHEEPIEFLEELLSGGAPDDILDNSETTAEIHQKLKVQLIKLFSILPSLTEKRFLVISHTLAARPQFWLAIELTGLEAPVYIPPMSTQVDDESIGSSLLTTANNVRAHRSNGYAQLRREHPELAELLLILMKVNLISWEPPL